MMLLTFSLLGCKIAIPLHICIFFLLPGRKTQRDGLHCCLLPVFFCFLFCLFVFGVLFLFFVCSKMVNILPYLAHVHLDFNQTWVIDAIWNTLYVHEVKF